jgi:hypothetical protein
MLAPETSACEPPGDCAACPTRESCEQLRALQNSKQPPSKERRSTPAAAQTQEEAVAEVHNYIRGLGIDPEKLWNH